MKKKKIRYKRKKQLPKNYIFIDDEVYDEVLSGSPINDLWHREILNAIYTLLMTSIDNNKGFTPTAITVEEIANVLSKGSLYDNKFFESVKKALDEIYEWDITHGNNLLGHGAERAIVYD